MLKVRISSFSYKRSGIPKDDTPHGGGFVFDCRFIYDPDGKFEYMHLTGRDEKVIDFLDKLPDMQMFLKAVYEIVDRAAENFIAREFTDVMVSFGCKGGKHRSVYAAEHLNEHLQKKFEEKITTFLTHIDMPKGTWSER